MCFIDDIDLCATVAFTATVRHLIKRSSWWSEAVSLVTHHVAKSQRLPKSRLRNTFGNRILRSKCDLVLQRKFAPLRFMSPLHSRVDL